MVVVGCLGTIVVVEDGRWGEEGDGGGCLALSG